MNTQRKDLVDFLEVFEEWFKLEKEWDSIDKDKIDQKPFLITHFLKSIL